MSQRIIDLTHPLVEGMPQYPGQRVAHFSRITDVQPENILMTEMCCASHIGTHVDAPAHFVTNGQTLFDMPLDRWVGSVLIIDVAPGDDGAIGPEQLSKPLEATGASLAGVLVRTGHSRHWGAPEYFGDSPFLDPASAIILAKAGLSFVGMDFASPDPVGARNQPSHEILLGAGLGLIESLANLEQLEGSIVWFCAAPLVVGEGDGAPCRAFVIQ